MFTDTGVFFFQHIFPGKDLIFFCLSEFYGTFQVFFEGLRIRGAYFLKQCFVKKKFNSIVKKMSQSFFFGYLIAVTFVFNGFKA